MIAWKQALFANEAILLSAEAEEGNGIVSLLGKLIEKADSYFRLSFRIGWIILLAALAIAVILVLHRYHKKVSRN